MARRRRRRINPADCQAGYTLVEVVIGMLLTAIMVSSIFSAALTAKTGGGRNDRRIVAASANKQVAYMLKNFVTADSSQSPANMGIAPPGDLAGGANGWGMTINGVQDNCPGGGTHCYALATGSHTLVGSPAGAGVLPAWFENAPYNGSIIYYVGAGAVPYINVTTTWTEP